MNQLKDKLKQNIGRIADDLRADAKQEKQQFARDRATFFLGQITGIQKFAKSFAKHADAQLIFQIGQVQELKIYLDLGFATFDDFLDGFSGLPFRKSSYYTQRKILEEQGSSVFDFLIESGISLQNRKLIEAGQISIEDDKIIVNFDDDSQEVLERGDESRILEAIDALARKNADKSREIARQKSTLEKANAVIAGHHDALEKVKAQKRVELEQDSHSIALMQLVAAFANLQNVASQLTVMEKDQFAPKVFEVVQLQLERMNDAYSGMIAATAKDKKQLPTPTATGLDALADDEELNEAELRALMD